MVKPVCPIVQGRVPEPMTISSGMFSSLPFQNFPRAAKISAFAWTIFSGVSCASSGRNGAASSVNCLEYSSMAASPVHSWRGYSRNFRILAGSGEVLAELLGVLQAYKV